MFSAPLPKMCNVPACHGSLICCFLSFIYIFRKKKKNTFFSFSFILIVWVKVAHVPWRNCTRSATWMVWPTGLGHLPPSYLYPGGVWRGGLLDTEVLLCPSVSPSAATAGCGWEGEGVRTPLVGLSTICAWD